MNNNHITAWGPYVCLRADFTHVVYIHLGDRGDEMECCEQSMYIVKGREIQCID